MTDSSATRYAGLVSALRSQIQTWRDDMRKDGKAGVAAAMNAKSDREYYGLVNVALTLQRCADDLEQVLAALVADPPPREQDDDHEKKVARGHRE